MGNVFTLLASVVGLGLLLEGGLRWGFGFGQPLIYVADPDIGYLLAPGQHTKRLGKQITINAYSMRSPEIRPSRSDHTLRVLLLGDSIANGGWWTDQRQMISALMQHQLQALLPPNQRAEVLNASANSWGPRNELAYVQRFGSFESQVIVLLLNTDDLFATAPNPLKVGRHPDYPDRKPPLALMEVWHRYLVRPQPHPDLMAQEALLASEDNRVEVNLAAIQQLQMLVQQCRSHLIVGITPLRREVTAGSREYEQQARQRLHEMARAADIPLVDFLPLFQALEQPSSVYHDSIHLNSLGNQLVSQHLSIALGTYWQETLKHHLPQPGAITQ